MAHSRLGDESGLMLLNDGSRNAPRLRTEINWYNLAELESATFPADPEDPEARLRAILDGGFEGVNAGDRELCGKHGVPTTAGFRAGSPEELFESAREAQRSGHGAAGVHLGTGMEGNRAAYRLLEAVCEATVQLQFPLYVETHRATLTQDIHRTVEFVREFPELRFLGDFSHWWTGLEWAYGDVDAKIDFVAPVLDRVAMIQGRIGTAGSIQVNVTDERAPHVEFFKTMWRRSMEGFLRRDEKGSVFVFASELLPASISYARKFPDAEGKLREESDRWEQALLLKRLAEEAWEAAHQR